MTETDRRQQEIVDEFALVVDWMLRSQQVIEHGERVPPLPDAEKTDDRLVRGCQSTVWLRTWTEDGAFRVRADSESALARGVASLLVGVFDGVVPAEAAAADLWFPREIGLTEHISSNRANGLDTMIRAIRAAARPAA
ncbi:SufE family protein [Rubrivirga sp. S365]|uniref:SufE family protein n=1 Tax=Rubrivirga litoralis TaxID=3075598 RepID=A0ABU3BTK0_9BACT|nr:MULTISPECIES: SufE family protein [unclassified Rubrivirga]MDT0632624.1 SufE family protein [Rubrivirga sp. F394]MDT7855446.1 SufE family protein [Rubrivirga sp. S365]